jgi:hypothetical protein
MITYNFQNICLLKAFQKENRPYKVSMCFSLDTENGMSPSRLLKDKSLNQEQMLNHL